MPNDSGRWRKIRQGKKKRGKSHGRNTDALIVAVNKQKNQPSEAEVMVTLVHKERTPQSRDGQCQNAQSLGWSRSREWESDRMADATASISALLHLDRHFPWIQNYLGGDENTPLSVHVRAFLKQLGPKDSAKPPPGKDALKFSHGDFGPIPMLLFGLHKFLLFYERGTGPSEETVLHFVF